MYAAILKDLCDVFPEDSNNVDNYLEACCFIDNLYQVLEVLKISISVKDLEFLPSFKGVYTSASLGTSGTIEENELRYLKMRYKPLLGDVKLKEQIIETIREMNPSSSVIIDDDLMIIVNK